LNIIIPHDLDAIAPGIAEIEKSAWKRLDSCLGQGAADSLFVIDDETEVASVVGGLTTTLLERQELVSKVDERRVFAAATQLEIE
jgi:hypothetical protein